MTDDIDYLDDEDLPPSKTSIKKAMHQITALGQQLVDLPAKKLNQVPLDDSLRYSIDQARTMKTGNAKRRQIQFIGKLMRKQDNSDIEHALNQFLEQDQQQINLHHLAEQWRDRLLTDNQAVTEFINQFPNQSVQQINQVLRAAISEQKKIKASTSGPIAPKETRKLFKLIREQLQPT